jgi:hypothetical protein
VKWLKKITVEKRDVNAEQMIPASFFTGEGWCTHEELNLKPADP